ncbi:hypothetical protein [Ornithinimicrobium tianjinense]|uniref:Uncharacterized protein n=1 Tax=Ornithinimicrobium tianjinense TaxID=1195761 RepID=A0A917BE60_9MICO|nr:hypothetical protein [Ornithinimicrobium tianjinense]GGF38668.1 hypothetical protein GCM10011366_02800 [Ornithinimicrobium tianjinense]
MSPNLSALVSGLLGGLVAGVFCAWATTQVLPVGTTGYSTRVVGLAVALAVLGAVIGVLVGWLVAGRRALSLGRIAAVVTVVGTSVGGTAWARRAIAEQADGHLVGTILLVGGLVIVLALAAGFTAAMLGPASLDDGDADGDGDADADDRQEPQL